MLSKDRWEQDLEMTITHLGGGQFSIDIKHISHALCFGEALEELKAIGYSETDAKEMLKPLI